MCKLNVEHSVFIWAGLESTKHASANGYYLYRFTRRIMCLVRDIVGTEEIIRVTANRSGRTPVRYPQFPSPLVFLRAT